MPPTPTTIRFSEEVYRRLDEAASTTGLPINSIVIAACIEWLDAHSPGGWAMVPGSAGASGLPQVRPSAIARIARAVQGTVVAARGMYSFERFSGSAKKALTLG